MAEQQRSGSGCLKTFLIVLVLVVLLVAGAAILAVTKLPGFLREHSGALLEQGATAVVDQFGYSPEQKEAVMKPVKEFGEGIRTGDISLEEAAAVAEEFLAGPAMTVLALEGFRVGYLEPSSLSAEEKAQGRMTLSRFITGSTAQKIPHEKAQELLNLVSEKQGSKQKLKEHLSPEEIRKFLGQAAKAADDAGIERREFSIDMGKEISRALEQGRANYRMSQGKK